MDEISVWKANGLIAPLPDRSFRRGGLATKRSRFVFVIVEYQGELTRGAHLRVDQLTLRGGRRRLKMGLASLVFISFLKADREL
jgi:hypothetical protein